MGLYQHFVLPRLIDFACGMRVIERQREKVVPRARGRVLEIGFGTGLNLPFYRRSRASAVVGLEPAPEMRARGERRIAALRRRGLELPVELLAASAEEIPADDASFDTVLVTYTLCTIPHPERALTEMRRVLHPQGRLVFCEHGAAPDPRVRRWQDRVDPIWRRLAGGCHLNRDVPALLAGAGFRVEEMETGYLPGWKPAGWNWWGSARG
ncbi:MAG TPA: class I SAM-dependent methyltransferase [Thermoanaerobaculia bacterium]|nr:class I SAM-dependent methyltransferase [Thermoanaerobaculia bacterium]